MVIANKWIPLYSVHYLKKLFSLHSIISKYRPVSSKLGQNIHGQNILDKFHYGYNCKDEFDHGSSDTRLLSVLEIEKLNFSSLFGIYLYC